MKKTLLLSVVASTMIMAGGDIAPVEPVVEAPAVVSGWEFGGQGVVYYQTVDGTDALMNGDNGLFAQTSSSASAGIQLRATNKDLFWGIGAGVEVSGLATLGLQEDVVSNVMQAAGLEQFGRGGWISQAYLTYGFNNTSFKVGRQELPASLSPFAHSEYWNVFANTYDAALIVNTDISNTTLVGAWVKSANQNGYFGYPNHSSFILNLSSSHDVGGLPFFPGNMANFNDLNDANGENGVFMLTAQNKSIEGLTLTGSWYYGSEFITTDDVNILWGDAQYDAGMFNVGVQGGTVMHDALVDETTAFGAKIGGKFGMFDASVAYSTVNDSDLGVFNLGGQQTPLYTQMLVNEFAIFNANDTVVVRAGVEVLGGKLDAAYGMTSSDYADSDYNEFDLSYTTKVFDSVDLMAAYVNIDDDYYGSDDLIRFVGRYNF